MQRTLVYKNKQYTLQEACKTFNISYTTLTKRLSRGWSVEAAITGNHIKPRRGNVIIINNIQYESIRHAMKELHTSRYSINKLLNNQSITTYIIDHIEYKSRKQAMSDLNITLKQFNKSVHYIDEYKIKVFDKHKQKFCYFKSKQELLKYYDIDSIEEVDYIGKPIIL